MSMLSSFFNWGFVASKCKTLLKLTIPRIKLLRNRREMQLKQMRRDIAKLLETGQEATARIRVEHIIREENMMAAQEIIELFCELIVVRLPIIESQRECPLDLKEAISSVCFAAPRFADLAELLQVQLLFASKYGKEFVAAATELMPDCGVNRQLIELLSVRAPSPEKKLKLLKEIAAEHVLDWDSTASETELFKKQEDLLNGPEQFYSSSKLPLPEEKHNEASYLGPSQPNKEQPEFDSGSDTLEFPEVPKVLLLSNANLAAAPEMVTPPVTPPCEVDFHSSSHSGVNADIKQEPVEKRSIIDKDEPQASGRMENKQFVPFISPPSVSPGSFSARHSDSPSSLLREKTEADGDLQDVLAAAHAAAETAEHAAAAAQSAASLAQVRINELTKKSSECEPDSTYENPFYTGHFTEQNTAGDYDSNGMNYLKPDEEFDAHVRNSELTKKNSECEPDSTSENPFYISSANWSSTTKREHLAEKNTAGAQIRISELTKKNSDCEPDGASENPFYTSSTNGSPTTERGHFTEKDVAGDYDGRVNYLEPQHDYNASPGSQSSSFPSFDTHKPSFDSSLPNYQVLDDKSSSLRPRNLPSMDDDLYSSYPNLFTLPNSNVESQTHSYNHRSNS